jgi:hypothetical protein
MTPPPKKPGDLTNPGGSAVPGGSMVPGGHTMACRTTVDDGCGVSVVGKAIASSGVTWIGFVTRVVVS